MSFWKICHLPWKLWWWFCTWMRSPTEQLLGDLREMKERRVPQGLMSSLSIYHLLWQASVDCVKIVIEYWEDILNALWPAVHLTANLHKMSQWLSWLDDAGTRWLILHRVLVGLGLESEENVRMFHLAWNLDIPCMVWGFNFLCFEEFLYVLFYVCMHGHLHRQNIF